MKRKSFLTFIDNSLPFRVWMFVHDSVLKIRGVDLNPDSPENVRLCGELLERALKNSEP